ncbi:MAG TPA: hypothetical protein VLM43_02265 [Desulfobacterales bacterium]|nr:hypothetical protein [Desulfobacterales bacterium]
MSESRECPRSKATGGEAAVGYRDPPAKKEIGYHQLSRRVNKIDIKSQNSYLIVGRDIKIVRIIKLLFEINTL